MMVAFAASDRPEISLRILDTAPRRRVALVTSTASRMREGISRLIRDSCRFVREVIRHRPAVVHLNTSGHLAFVRDIAVLTIAKAFKVPVVYHLRFGRLADAAAAGTWEWRLARVALRLATSVIALDARTAACIATSGRARSVRQMPNPLHPAIVVDEPATERRNVVLYVGWLIRTKGIEDLLTAWTALAPRGWRLELAGPVDETYLADLRSRGCLDGVDWLGPLAHSDVLSKMASAAILAFPSHTEGFPNAVAEAMASGMAIVATDVGAIASMLAEGAGLVVPPQDAESLQRALQEIMASPELRKSLGASARERAVAEYALPHVFDAYVDLWRSVSVKDQGGIG